MCMLGDGHMTGHVLRYSQWGKQGEINISDSVSEKNYKAT